MISAEKIKEHLLSENLSVKVYDLLDSTNAEAKRYASGYDRNRSPVLFVAKEQSAGRGRMGRRFLSRADSGIYMSLLYFTDKELSDAVSVTTAAAAIVAEAIEKMTEKSMKIKWVNDIYNDEGKVCGILAETVKAGDLYAVIVGIGINTGDIDFPDELRGIASTVGDMRGKENALVAMIADGLLAHATDPADRSYMDDYRRRFMLDGEEVDLYVNGELTDSGRVVGVDDDGGLMFLPNGEKKVKTIHSGEVSVRKK